MYMFMPGAMGPRLNTGQFLTAFFYSGAMPETEADMPFDTTNINNLNNYENFVGSQSFYTDVFGAGMSRNDGVKLSISGNASANAGKIPFGLVNKTVEGSKDWWQMIPNQIHNWDAATESEIIPEVPLNTANVGMGVKWWNLRASFLSIWTDGGNYLDMNSSVIGSYIEYSYKTPFVCKKVFSCGHVGTGPHEHFRPTDIQALNESTGEWETLGQIETYVESTVVLDSNTLSAKKYRFVLTANAPYSCKFTKLQMFTDIDPMVVEDQPTWCLLLHWGYTQSAQWIPTQPGFIWGSVSGPGGVGDFIVSSNNLKVGDRMALASDRFIIEPVLKGVAL